MENKINKYIKALAKNLKEQRLNLGLTQKEMAEKMGVKYQSYQAYERGISSPSLENLLKIAEIYNSSLDDLFEREK